MIPDFVTVGGTVLEWILTAHDQANSRACGGNSFYSAVGAHIWSDRVGVITHAGSDYPQSFLRDFADAGIDIRGVSRIDEPHRLLFIVQYNDHGDRRSFTPEAVADWGKHTPEQLEKYLVPPASPMMFEGSSKYDAMPDEVPADFWKAKAFHEAPMRFKAQRAFAEALHARGIPFTLDSSGRGAPAGEFLKVLQQVPVFLPSETDVADLLGDVKPEDAVRQLSAMGPQVVSMKLGRQGSLVYDRRTGRSHRVPVYPTYAKDPTGAGDSYCGGFLVGWLETGDAFEAALRGTVSSSFVVEYFDARHALRVTRQEAERRLNRLRAIATRI